MTVIEPLRLRDEQIDDLRRQMRSLSHPSSERKQLREFLPRSLGNVFRELRPKNLANQIEVLLRNRVPRILTIRQLLHDFLDVPFSVALQLASVQENFNPLGHSPVGLHGVCCSFEVRLEVVFIYLQSQALIYGSLCALAATPLLGGG